MTFHPESLKLTGDLKAKNDAVTERTVLYQGISHYLNDMLLVAVCK